MCARAGKHKEQHDAGAARGFGILLVSNILETTALALILPAYPLICKEMGIDLKTRGLMVSLYSLLQFCMSPLLGRASDVVGRTTMLRVSALASMGSYAAILLARDPWVFMLGRVLPGLVKCGISVSQAYITDISSQHDRPKNLGVLGSMYGLAFVFGPAVGGMLMRQDPWMTVRVALAATALNVVVLLFLAEPTTSGKRESGPTTSVEEEVREGEKAPANGLSFMTLLRQSGTTGTGSTVALLLARKLCVSFASGLFETTLAEYCSRHLNLDGHVLGLLFSYLGVLSVLNNTVIIRFLSQRFENEQLLLPAILGQTAALAMWSYVHNTFTLCVVLAALSVSSGLFTTFTQDLLSKATPHELIGSILGVSYALETFAKVLTPPLGGYLLEQRGPHTLGWASVLFLLPCVANVALETFRRGYQPQVEVKKKVA